VSAHSTRPFHPKTGTLHTSTGDLPFEHPPVSGQVGPYFIDHSIGRGGMARVYLAHPVGAGLSTGPVALKVSQDCELGSAVLVREALILQTLDHPGVVRVHHVDAEGDLTYMAMEPLQGCSLSQRIKQQGALPLSVCVDIGIQICEVLEYLHGTGPYKAPHAVIHGDIKPANLMLGPSGRVTLIDFGIAHTAYTDSKGIVGFGTPGYMAPEQWGQGPVDPRTDLFMLGVVLFELATGTRLFPSEDLPTLQNTAGGDASWSPIHHLPGTYSTELFPFMDILSECVADLNCRTPTAGHLAETLRKLQWKLEAPGSVVAWTRTCSVA